MNERTVTVAEIAEPAGLLSFRCVARLRTTDGRRVAAGQLYRSATTQFVADTEARRFVEQSGLTTIIDLRLPHEAVAEGSGGFAADDGPVIVNVPFAIRTTVGEGSAVAPMVDPDPLIGTYLNYLTDRTAFVRIIETLLAPQGLPAMVHCTVGKDRTGVAVAILLDALGVLRSDIAADYAASSADVGTMMQRLRTMASYGDAVDVYPAEAYSADPATIARFLAWVEIVHGGSREYLRGLGITGDQFGQLETRLLEPDDAPPMSQILRSARIAATADDVWAVIGDVEGVHRWVPGLAATVLDGDVRSVTFDDGGIARERIVAHHPSSRSYVYQYVDGPIPLDFYVSSLTVGPDPDGASLVVWTATLRADPPSIEAVEGMYDAALAQLAVDLRT